MFEKPTDEQLVNRFVHYPPKGDQTARYEKVRAAALEFAILVRDLTPCSAEQTRSINAIDEAMFLANAAIARSE